MKLFPSLEINKEERECKGIFWRASISSYISSFDSLEIKKSLRLLKKKSCRGCPQCEFAWEFLNEAIFEDLILDYLPNIEHGAIYTYQINKYQNYFELYPEYEIEIVKVEK